MERIARQMRETENMLVFLASSPELPEIDRARLLPVLESHLVTINRFKTMQCTGDPR